MNQEDADSLKNASLIIERFGGIRPMAAKIGAPVTTVQGWKKRDVIPSSRRDDIIRAAASNHIDISDLVSDEPVSSFADNISPVSASSVDVVEDSIKAEESAFIDLKKGGEDNFKKPDTARDDEPRITVEPIYKPEPKPMPSSFTAPMDRTHEDLMAAISASQKKAVRTSTWTAVALIALCAGAAAVFLWPSAQKIERHEEQLATLEGKMGAIDEDVQSMNESAGFIRDMVPEDLQKSFSELKLQADDLTQAVQKAALQADDLASGVVGEDAGSFSDRLAIIEAKLGDVEGGQTMRDLATRIRNLEVSIGGQEQLNASIDELRKIVDNVDTRVTSFDQKLAEVQQDTQTALGQTLQGVDNNDLKAAAMLIAFSQFRESLNRSAPFEEDLALLQKMVGEDDPSLKEALDKLAPQAEKGGILTSEGLSNEFRGLAGDIVVSSLNGEDLSLADQAKVRFTQALNVKKDGELVGGTPTQKAVAKAQTQLDNGDVQGAIATLQQLDGPARQTAMPFLQQAQATVLAEQVQDMMRQLIVANVGTGVSPASGTAAEPSGFRAVTDSIQNAIPGQGVVKDEESGLTILPAPKGFKGFSSVPSE